MVGTTSGLGGFMSGASIRFSKLKSGMGGADAWRDGLAQSHQRSADRRPRTTGMKLPRVQSIHKATVVSMQPFGAFVQLGAGDSYKDGLLHVSHLGETRFESPEEAGLAVGTQLWVKVLEVNNNDLKYSLDMRYVSQRDGTDLDPYNAKGRLPDNFWSHGNGKVKPAGSSEPPRQPPRQQPPPQLQKSEAPEAPVAALKRKADDEDSDSKSSTDEREKVSKKLEKAKKKLEKAKKKAEKAKEKARKKLEKKAKKKDKEDKKKKKADSSSSSASSSI